MGVIRKTDHNIGIFESVSEESLGIPHSSDDDSQSVVAGYLNRASINTTSRHSRVRSVPMSFDNTRSNTLGRKKYRRHENGRALEALVEEEEFDEVSIQDIIQTEYTSFSKIFADTKSLVKWNNFIECSEEDQNSYIQPNCKILKIANDEEAFLNINAGLRAMFKKRLPTAMLRSLEIELVDFFTENPMKIHVSTAKTSYQRLLVHALAEYHLLESQSYNTPTERLVRVTNCRGTTVESCSWSHTQVLLSDYLQQRQDIRLAH